MLRQRQKIHSLRSVLTFDRPALLDRSVGATLAASEWCSVGWASAAEVAGVFLPFLAIVANSCDNFFSLSIWPLVSLLLMAQRVGSRFPNQPLPRLGPLRYS